MLSGPAWSKESAHKKSPEAQYSWASEPSMRSVREKIRTPDLLIRSQTLYPAELRALILQCNIGILLLIVRYVNKYPVFDAMQISLIFFVKET